MAEEFGYTLLLTRATLRDAHCWGSTSYDRYLRRPLEKIKQELTRIEAVVRTLQSLEAVTTERYTKNSETLMIDIRKELQEKLEVMNKKKFEPPR